MFGTYLDLIEFLPASEASYFLKPDTDLEEFGLKELTKENIIKEIRDYLPFAYSKAEGARGISSSRSLMHFDHWLWLLADDELLEFLHDDDNYEMYGFPVLQKIAKKYAPEMVKKYKNIANNTGAPLYEKEEET